MFGVGTFNEVGAWAGMGWLASWAGRQEQGQRR
jgi:hypothetical protein